MEFLLQLVLLAIGFFLLGKGSDWFVDGAAGIARRFGISQIVIGLTIVAMGTSLPEAGVSIEAAFNHNAGISIGNIVGSNIMNIQLILGFSALVATLPMPRMTILIELPFLIAVSALLYWLGLKGELTFTDGCIFLVLFAIFLCYMYYLPKLKKRFGLEYKEDEPAGIEGSVGKIVGITVVGIALIFFGAQVTVGAATALAKLAGVSDRIIGLTLVALGTSLPELCTSVTAAWKGNTDLAIGNIVGSNIFNILFVLGTSALLTNIPYARSFNLDSQIMVGTAILLLLLALPKRRLNRVSGLIFLLAFAGYMYRMYMTMNI